MDVERCLLALMPILSLLVMLLALRQSVQRAAGLGFLLAAALGSFFFGAAGTLLLAASLKGVLHALPIIGVIFGTLLLYAGAEALGILRRLQQFLQACSTDLAVQALVVGWLFAHLLQGISGFGVPVMICAPLLVRLGIPPLRAVLIALLGQCWGNTFGTIGLAWDGLLTQVTLTPSMERTVLVLSSSYLLLVCLLSGFLIAYLADGWSGLRRTFFLILCLGILQGEGQTLFSYVHAELANFLASLLGFGAFLLWRRTGGIPAAAPPVPVGPFRKSGRGGKTLLASACRYALCRTRPVATAVVLLLAMSEIMVTTGQTRALAEGLAALTGKGYLLAAPFVGLLGSFMTASNLSSNILFAAFQQQMGTILHLPVEQLLALQTAGGAVGTLLSPSNVFLGTSTAGIAGQEGIILRQTMLIAVICCMLFALAALVLS